MKADSSLWRRLLLALVPALLMLAAAGAVIDYLDVSRVVDDAYDQTLASTALGLAARLESERDDDLPVHMTALARQGSAERTADAFDFVVLDAAGQVIGGHGALAVLAGPEGAPNPGFRDARVDGVPMRVATYRYAGPDGQALIVVAQPLAARRAAAQHALHITAWTNVAMICAVLIVVLLGVRKALGPLHALGARASLHDTRHLGPLDNRSVPREVRPLVDGINRLIERLRNAAQAQQDFLNAGAHQLRTPLAGLQAQLDVLSDDLRGTRWQGRVENLGGSVRRLTRLTQQMLSLARADANSRDGLPDSAVPVDLVALLQELAAQALDTAVERHVDLGVEAEPAVVLGEHWMLREMVANLVDNALHHAPPASQVTVRSGMVAAATGASAHAYIEVEDAGPGIPHAQRERVFERFVRLPHSAVPGTGLGLAIVREVAHWHGAIVRVLDGQGGRGTRVRVEFGARA
jgi:two-component system sensor histidine kinase TctE